MLIEHLNRSSHSLRDSLGEFLVESFKLHLQILSALPHTTMYRTPSLSRSLFWHTRLAPHRRALHRVAGTHAPEHIVAFVEDNAWPSANPIERLGGGVCVGAEVMKVWNFGQLKVYTVLGLGEEEVGRLRGDPNVRYVQEKTPERMAAEGITESVKEGAMLESMA
ncbi:hypothetical protein EJ06DRAFT_581891 [Trichodelitschia bisporula]|uniref:Uncharacterized protein n=1 Tax=Trichodelitschia bisporula TaxID=703511 RepID=A0A6G1HXQ7_9PEZI|nr:hypothetical protein EJ06DRAFT_581891 [Trichodelitschia bisporula]